MSSSSYIAIVIEPRLSHVYPCRIAIQSVRATLPDWPIRWIHGPDNAKEAGDIAAELGVELQELEYRNITREQYSAMLTSSEFWSALTAEHVLIFQSDSALSPTSPHTISEFLEYDYVGAPWTHDPLNGRGHVGNGGLSLRKPSAMLRAIKLIDAGADTHPEDLVLCRAMHTATDTTFHLPSVEVAAHFSTEMQYSDSSRSLGLHSPWLYLTNEHLSRLSLQSPYFAAMINWYHDTQVEHCVSLDRVAIDRFTQYANPMLLNPLSFSFPSSKIRTRVADKIRLISPLNPYDRTTYVYTNEDAYMRQYEESWLALSPPKAGHDCFRHLEILASRCIPLIGLDDCHDTIMIHYPKHLLQHIFHTIQEQCKRQFNTTDIRVLMNESAARQFIVSTHVLRQWSNTLFAWFREHLTCIQMAKWMLVRIGLSAFASKRLKVLMIDTTLEGEKDEQDDYTASMTYIGLKELLGLDATSTHDAPLVYEGVQIEHREHLTKAGPKQVTVYGRGFNWLGVLPHSVRDARLTEAQIRQNIQARHYDCVIYLSVRHEFYLRDIVHRNYPKERVVYIDGRDKVTEFTPSGHETWFIRPWVSIPLHIERLQPLDTVKKKVAVCVYGSNMELALQTIPSVIARIPYPTAVFLAGHVSDGFASSMFPQLCKNNTSLCNITPYDEYTRILDMQLTPPGLGDPTCIPTLRNLQMCAHMVECYEDSSKPFDCVITLRSDILAQGNWVFELPFPNPKVVFTTPPFKGAKIDSFKEGVMFIAGKPCINEQVMYGPSKIMGKLLSTISVVPILYKGQQSIQEILYTSAMFHGITLQRSSVVTYKLQ